MEKENRIGFAINGASHLFKRAIDNAINIRGQEKLTGVHGYIIGYLAKNSHKDIFQKDIENELTIRRSTATAILQLMEKNGYIVRVPFEKDGRLKKILLTEKSKKRHLIFKEEIDRLEDKINSGLNEEEIKEFFRIIEKIKSNIGDEIK
jgi:DNA-binding MarR family transcriptional regulator